MVGPSEHSGANICSSDGAAACIHCWQCSVMPGSLCPQPGVMVDKAEARRKWTSHARVTHHICHLSEDCHRASSYVWPMHTSSPSVIKGKHTPAHEKSILVCECHLPPACKHARIVSFQLTGSCFRYIRRSDGAHQNRMQCTVYTTWSRHLLH